MTTDDDRYEEELRRFYDAFANGDLDEALRSCSENVVFHIPGTNQLSGDYGRNELSVLAGKFVQSSDGTFREELLDVMIGSSHVVALLHHKLTRDGESRGYLTLELWRVEDGKFAESWLHPRDPIVFDQVWR